MHLLYTHLIKDSYPEYIRGWFKFKKKKTKRILEWDAISISRGSSQPRNWTHVSYSAREGDDTPLHYSCLENPMDGGAWWAAVHEVAQSQTGLSDFTFTFHFNALEKEMATHCSILAWRIPGTEEPGGLPSMGSHRVGHDWSNLAAAAAAAAAPTRQVNYFPLSHQGSQRA